MAEAREIFDPEHGRIEFISKLELSDIIIFVLGLLWSTLMLFLIFYAFFFAKDLHLLKFFGILILFGFLGTGSFCALFQKSSLVIDKIKGKVIYSKRFLWRKKEENINLSDFNFVSIVSDYSMVRGAHAPVHTVCLTGTDFTYTIVTKNDYQAARQIAKRIANFVGLELSDYSSGHVIISQTGTLNGSVKKCAAFYKQQIHQITKPDSLKAEYKEKDRELSANIPAPGLTGKDWVPILIFYGVISLCLALGIFLWVRSLMDVSKMNQEPGSFIFVIIVIVLWIFVTTTIRIFRFIRSAFQRTTIQISPENLKFAPYGSSREKIVTIPTEQVEVIEVVEEEHFLRNNLFKVVSQKSHITAISNQEKFDFGYGLSINELHWLRAQILRFILEEPKDSQSA